MVRRHRGPCLLTTTKLRMTGLPLGLSVLVSPEPRQCPLTGPASGQPLKVWPASSLATDARLLVPRPATSQTRGSVTFDSLLVRLLQPLLSALGILRHYWQYCHANLPNTTDHWQMQISTGTLGSHHTTTYCQCACASPTQCT